MRKGYEGEYRAKKELMEEFNRNEVIKVAIGSFGADYLVASCGEILKIIEVKTIHNKKKWYPSKREKEQIKRIIEFAKQHKINAYLWIYKCYGKGKSIIKEEKILFEK